MASGSACPTKVRHRVLLTINRQQIIAALLHAARAIAGDVAGRRMAPAVLTSVGAAGGSVSLRGIVVVVAGASAARQPIQDQAGRSNTSGVHKRERASNGVARSLSGPHYHAGSLDVRYHEKGIAHSQDRCAIDYDAVELFQCGGDQFLEAIATKEFGRVRRHLAASQNNQLASSGFRIARFRNIQRFTLDCSNEVRCLFQLDIANKAIDYPNLRLLVVTLLRKYLVNTWAAQISVD